MPTLQEIGAFFVPDYNSLTDATFAPGVSQADAEAYALDYFMDGWDIPHGRGAEEIIKADSTTAIFSGAKGGFGEWDIFDRKVWVVVLSDLPISLPGGGGLVEPGAPPKPEPKRSTIRFHVAVDANTGEVLSSELTGSGSPSSSWDGIDLSRDEEHGPVTPTPTPTWTPAAAPGP